MYGGATLLLSEMHRDNNGLLKEVVSAIGVLVKSIKK